MYHTITAIYFHAIVESLVKMGYERNKSMRGAPYDFRKAASKLTQSQWTLTHISSIRAGLESMTSQNGGQDGRHDPKMAAMAPSKPS